MQTNELRRVVESRLYSIITEQAIAEISYRIGSEDAMFPHIVWDITGIRPTDHGREDYELDVHIYTQGDAFKAYSIADAVIDLFRFTNIPQEDGLLPTFYESSAFSVEDTDKSIVHVVVRLEGHAYDATEGGFEWQQ